MQISKKLISAISVVWDDIAFDVPEAEVEAFQVVEYCVDADRLSTRGYPEQQAEFRTLSEKLGYPGAVEAVAKQMPFQYYEGGGAAEL